MNSNEITVHLTKRMTKAQQRANDIAVVKKQVKILIDAKVDHDLVLDRVRCVTTLSLRMKRKIIKEAIQNIGQLELPFLED